MDWIDLVRYHRYGFVRVGSAGGDVTIFWRGRLLGLVNVESGDIAGDCAFVICWCG